MLYFYPKDDTSGCTREAQDFTLLAAEFEKAGVSVVGVSRDPMKSHDKFIAKYSLAVPLASDADGRISDAFGVWVEKSMYGRKYMGMERATYLIGTDGRVLSLVAQGQSAQPCGRSAEDCSSAPASRDSLIVDRSAVRQASPLSSSRP